MQPGRIGGDGPRAVGTHVEAFALRRGGYLHAVIHGVIAPCQFDAVAPGGGGVLDDVEHRALGVAVAGGGNDALP